MTQANPVAGHCWSCNHVLGPLDYGRQDVCGGCRRDTRVCKNCEHYDTNFNNHCRESQADPVPDKEKSNFCDYFKPRGGSNAGAKNTTQALLSAAEALFKK